MEEEFLYNPTPEEIEQNWKAFDKPSIKERSINIEKTEEGPFNNDLDHMWLLKMQMREREEDTKKLKLETKKREEDQQRKADEKRRSKEKFWELVMVVVFLIIVMVVLGVCNLVFQSRGLPAPR